MWPKNIDPNAVNHVTMHLEQGISTGCRLCRLRTRYKDLVVVVEPENHDSCQMYCGDCYEYLRLRAICDMADLPHISKLAKPVIIDWPLYLLKQHDPFKLYFPKDAIDLGRLKQQRRFCRESEKRSAADGASGS